MSSSLTTTSYATLGLLSLRPWTTYELAVQMERTLRHIWPRARSKLYEEPKKLVAHGLATASRESVGRRPRTVYAITPKGRRALVRWLEEPGDGPSLEFEQLTKLFFADQGSPEAALRTVLAARAWAAAEMAGFAEAVRAYRAGGGPFPERLGTTMLGARFLTDLFDLVYRWSEWAACVAERRLDGGPAEVDWDVLDAIVQRADEIAEAEARRPVQARRRVRPPD